VLFLDCGGFLLDRPLIVFHSVCVFVLWSHVLPRCSFQMFCLCMCMSAVICLFSSGRAGSFLFAFLWLSLCVIFVMMCLGSSLHVVCIFPLGMLCLSACRRMFVRMVFDM